MASKSADQAEPTTANGASDVVETPAPPLTRDQIRAKIFGAKAKSVEIEFLGAKIELRQPDLGVVIDSRSEDGDQSILMLMNYAYVPGTDDKVFEAADEDGLRHLPFGEDMVRLSTTVAELLGTSAATLSQQVTDATKSTGG